jgi:hypothetical protein
MAAKGTSPLAPRSARYALHTAAWVAGLAVALLASPALTATPSAADKETSRALYVEGMQALDAHDYAGVPSVNVGSWSLAAGVGGT